MAVIEGVQVVPVRRPVGPLLAAGIEEPANGGSVDSHLLTVRGWVVGKAGPVAAVEAVAEGWHLAAAPVGLPTPDLPAQVGDGGPWAGTAGFSLTFDTLGLGPEFEVRVRATADGAPVARIGVVRGRRRPLAPPQPSRLRALLLTSIGRTGTTLLARLLAAHPAIVAYRRHPYEARAAKYWLHLLKTLARPPDPAGRPGQPNAFHLEPAIGGNPFAAPAFAPYPEAAAWAGGPYLEAAAGFCRAAIDGWYGAVATAQGQAAPVYWLEKSFPDEYAALARELYPAGKEIVLVRDFRDMWASMRAFNARRGFGDFGRERAGSDEAWLAELRRGADRLAATVQARGESARLVRYEDLLADAAGVLVGLLDYLDFDRSPATIAAMVAGAAADLPELQTHRTSATVAASVGRWRRDLPPALQTQAAAAFADVLPVFGYDPA